MGIDQGTPFGAVCAIFERLSQISCAQWALRLNRAGRRKGSPGRSLSVSRAPTVWWWQKIVVSA